MKSFRQLLFLLAVVFTLGQSANGAPRYALPPAPRAFAAKVMLDRRLGWAISTAKRGYVLLKTTDGGKHWLPTEPPDFWPRITPQEMSENDEQEEEPSLSFFSPQAGAVATTIYAKDGASVAIRVASTTDGGRHWHQTQFRTPDWLGSINFQFADATHGFILALSEPAAGLMEKQVYRTSDGNRSWRLAADGIASGDSFYPTGMTFRDPRNGWIAATYHGQPDVPIYRSQDGGRTWRLQSLPEPDIYKDGGYGNTYPPHFFGPQRREGTLAVAYRNWNINRFETIIYVTHDGGQTWRIGRRKRTRSEN